MTEATKHYRPWRLRFHLHHRHRLDNDFPSLAAPQVASPVAPVVKTHGGFIDFTQNIPTDIPYPPFINVEGVPNFRDIGGYTCAPASTPPSEAQHKFAVRQAYVYRCSELSQLTPKGHEVMTETLRIRTLYDLRSEAEAANALGQLKGINCISTPVFRKADITITMGIQQLRWSTAPDMSRHAGFSQGYVDWYRQIAVYGGKYAYRIIFEHIRDKPNEPFVFHCTAGKDRTGVLSALILKLCGVDNHTVAWEYALTVPGMGVWEEAVEQEMVGDSMMPIRSHGGMTREEAHRVCGSRASNMEQWLKVVLEREFGGPEMYLTKYCNFSDEDVAKIKRNLIASGEGPIKPVALPRWDDHPQT